MKEIKFIHAIGLAAVATSTPSPLFKAAHQRTSSLAMFLEQRDPATLPRNELCIDSGRILSGGVARSLADFNRIETAIGDLHVIVPSKMVLIEDKPTEMPNFYGGFSTSQKIIYLLTLLTRDQLEAIKGDGLSKSGLSEEAARVFDSIVPEPFVVEKSLVGNDGEESKRESETLSAGMRRNLRLQVFKSLDLYVRATGSEQLYLFGLGPSNHPGEEILRRNRFSDVDANSSYGVTIRREVANRPKPSAVDYDSTQWNRTLLLPKTSSIGTILRSISEASGVPITADPRVSRLSVTWTGESARMGDVLKSLALGVTGTYRKVGPYLHLTSDQIGLGTRRLKLALWQESLRMEAERSIQKCRESVGVSEINSLKFPADIGFEPSPGMKRAIDATDNSVRTFFKDSDLTPEIRSAVDECAKDFPRQPFEREEYAAKTNIKWRFILPNGLPLRPEGPSLGSPRMYQRKPESVAPVFKPIEVSDREIDASLFFTARSPEEARSILAEVSLLHFKDYWLRAEDGATIRAALGAAGQVPVNLVIAPLNTPLKGNSSSDPDVNLLGELMETVNGRFASLRQKAGNDSFFLHPSKITLSPIDPNLGLRADALIQLASIPGLEGVILIDHQSPGYQAFRSNVGSAIAAAELEQRNLGYSTSMRIAFLSQFSSDPIDVVPPNLTFAADTRQPFFKDWRLAAVPDNSKNSGTDPDAEDAARHWYEFRNAQWAQFVKRILKRFGLRNAMVEVPLDSLDLPPVPRYVAKWFPGESLQTATFMEVLQDALPNHVKVLSLTSAAPSSVEVAAISEALRRRQKLAIDVSSLDPEGIHKVVGSAFLIKERH